MLSYFTRYRTLWRCEDQGRCLYPAINFHKPLPGLIQRIPAFRLHLKLKVCALWITEFTIRKRLWDFPFPNSHFTDEKIEAQRREGYILRSQRVDLTWLLKQSLEVGAHVDNRENLYRYQRASLVKINGD